MSPAGDVTAAELVIEAFYPADPATAQALEGAALDRASIKEISL
jgi:hypothetical protein